MRLPECCVLWWVWGPRLSPWSLDSEQRHQNRSCASASEPRFTLASLLTGRPNIKEATSWSECFHWYSSGSGWVLVEIRPDSHHSLNLLWRLLTVNCIINLQSVGYILRIRTEARMSEHLQPSPFIFGTNVFVGILKNINSAHHQFWPFVSHTWGDQKGQNCVSFSE